MPCNSDVLETASVCFSGSEDNFCATNIWPPKLITAMLHRVQPFAREAEHVLVEFQADPSVAILDQEFV